MVSLDEADMIEALRKSLNITLEEHAQIESKIRHEYERAKSGGKGKVEAKPESTAEKPPTSDSGPLGPIGDLSTDELSKDLDALSMSIGKFGEVEPKEPATVIEPPEEVKPESAEISTSSSLLEKLKSEYEHKRSAARVEEAPVEEKSAPESEPEPSEQISIKAEMPVEQKIPEAEGEAEAAEEEPTIDTLIDVGKKAFRNKDYQSALVSYKDALKIEPENKEVKFFIKKIMTAMKESKPQVAAEPEPERRGAGAPASEVIKKEVIIEEPKPPQPSEPKEKASAAKTCTSCDSTGVCSWCKGSKKCYWCKGSGKCTKCQGTKEIDGKMCKFCRGEGSCASCAGTGNCTWCKGTGKCTSCSAT